MTHIIDVRMSVRDKTMTLTFSIPGTATTIAMTVAEGQMTDEDAALVRAVLTPTAIERLATVLEQIGGAGCPN